MRVHSCFTELRVQEKPESPLLAARLLPMGSQSPDLQKPVSNSLLVVSIVS